MKSILLFFLLGFALAGSQTQAQSDIWFQQGHEWYYNVYCLANHACGYKHFSVLGDTAIAGKAGVVLQVHTLEEWGVPQVESVILRAAADTVFRYSPEAQRWHMIYDMGAEVGDIWNIQEDEFLGYGDMSEGPPWLFRVEVTAVSSIEILGETRHKLSTTAWTDGIISSYFHFGYGEGTIIEGVGPVESAHGLYGQSLEEALPLQSPSFQCFLRNETFVYGNEGAPCNAVLSTHSQSTIEFSMYPNPAANQIFVALPEIGQGTWNLSITDLQGRVVQEVNAFVAGHISVGHLPAGMYLLHARDGQGRVGVKKFVKGD